MAYAGNSAERTAFECLGVLHAWGYQKLRLSTAISPSGLNLRYVIALVSHFEPDGMIFDYKYADEALLSSSGGQSPPFH